MKEAIINNSKHCGIAHKKQSNMGLPEYQAVPKNTILNNHFLTNKSMIKEATKKEIYLQTPNNRANYYCYIMETMKKRQPLFLTIGIEPNYGVPFYQTKIKGITKTVYITKEMYKQIYAYLKNKTISYKIPNVTDVSNNRNQDFILRLLKVDKANNVTRYTTTTKEYKAVYPNGTINYGKLPYTRNELEGKLNSLVSKYK